MRVVVIGGDAAGMSSASQIKRKLGESVEIIVVNEQDWTSYSACGIPYWVAGEVADGPEALIARSPDEHRSRGIDVRSRVRATAIDPDAQVVTAVSVDEPADEQHFSYDQLIIGTGAAPLTPPIPGIDLPGVHRVHTIDNGLAAIDALAEAPRNAVVVGAGFIGLEMAEACVMRGLATTVIDLAPEPMAVMDRDMGELVRAAMTEHGVDFRGEEPAVDFVAAADGTVAAVRTAAGEYAADIVFLGLGVRPRNELAVAAGLPIGDSGGITIDDHCRVAGWSNIWAGGDCVENYHRVAGQPAYVPLGTHANKHGRVIGLNISGLDVTFPGILGTAITKFMDTEIARVGLSEQQAVDLGLDPVTATISSRTKPGYFPGSAPITVKVVAGAPECRLLGYQIVGGPGSGKRIDTAAAALWSGMTAADVVDLDLAYAPPFSPVWDPVQVAARRVMAERDLRCLAPPG